MRWLGRQPLLPEAHPAIRPTPPPAPRWPIRPTQDGRPPQPSSAEFQRGLRWGLPTACGFLAAWGIIRCADVPTACPSPAPAPPSTTPPAPASTEGFSPDGEAHFRTASPPTGTPFPQCPLPPQPPASFPPQAREPRPPPEQTPRSLPADSRNDHSPTTGRSATPTQDPSTRTNLALSPNSGPGMPHPPPPASRNGHQLLSATASRGCRNDPSRNAFHVLAAQRPALEPQADRREACRLKLRSVGRSPAPPPIQNRT
jgi:hypothetical protein